MIYLLVYTFIYIPVTTHIYDYYKYDRNRGRTTLLAGLIKNCNNTRRNFRKILIVERATWRDRQIFLPGTVHYVVPDGSYY